MNQVKFDKSFIAQVFLAIAGIAAASRFSLINQSAAPVQALAFMVSSALQSALQNNYRLEKGYFLASFLGMASLGAALKTSWKVNLALSAAFMMLQFVSSRFQKPKTQSSNHPTPITSKLTSSMDHPIQPKNHYIQLEISANPQQEQTLLPPPAEFIFCIDISDSMRASRLGRVKNVLISLLSKMEEALKMSENRLFYLSLITFNDTAKTIQDKVQVTGKNLTSLRSAIQGIYSDGVTSIMAGLEESTRVLESSCKSAANLSLLNWMTTFFATPLETAQTVDTCARSLIFLTDGKAEMEEPRVRELQKKWTETSVNLFAIGISKDHDANIMKMIVCHKDGELLPNASYQWVPDSSNTTSMEGTTLDKAVDAIFSQTFNQTIQSISVRQTNKPTIKLLNCASRSDGSFEIGALSSNQTIEKFFHCDFPNPKKLELEITVKTVQNNPIVLSTLAMIDDTYLPAINLAGIKQRIVAMNTQLAKITDKVQRTVLAQPLLEDIRDFSIMDDDLNSLCDDLNKAIEGQANNPDIQTRQGRMQRRTGF